MTVGRSWDPYARRGSVMDSDPFFGGGALLDPWTAGFGGRSMYDPWEDFSLISRPGFNVPSVPREISAVANARVDWVETPDAHLFKADLPGLSKEDIKIQVTEDNVLNISGERSKEEVNESDWFRRAERSYGKFSRWFRLPPDARPEEVKARMEHGVLTVEVPKHEGARLPQVRQVQITE
ncbi:hypothetical protein R1flu_011909 [Riccia fluitans]|uniref:SHSP domain-containing protein n=1 Tax=Riccia fluitans TaxID=41844 RepID=A0ABD1Z939_9MARC